MNKDAIKTLITDAIQCDYIEVKGDDGRHFEALVVSPQFEGISLLQQHKMVTATLGDRIKNDIIHAISIKTYTPAQWNK